MPYDFDQLIDRRSTNSYKWDIDEYGLPMWVADMDFETAPVVTKAIEKRVKQNAFGYSVVTDSFKKSIMSWWERRHDWIINKEWILFCTGAVPAISSIVRKMTSTHENIVVLSPVYNIFYNSIFNNNRKVLTSDLNYSHGIYTINFDDLEEKLSNPMTSMFIFCNPHNPIGKVWDKETLKRVGELCVKYQVILISDELHCDLTHPEYTYTPMASISQEISSQTVTLVSASKAFNLAGLQSSAIIISNEEFKKRIERGINTDEIAEPNAFAIQATEAAFNKGETWLNALNLYLESNRQYLIETLEILAPEIKLIPSEATYLAWLDCSLLSEDAELLCYYIRNKTGLYLSEGKIFGKNGKSFIRLNYACPRQHLTSGIQRFVDGIILFKQEKQNIEE
jgi:cystathionine beta-lyase